MSQSHNSLAGLGGRIAQAESSSRDDGRPGEEILQGIAARRLRHARARRAWIAGIGVFLALVGTTWHWRARNESTFSVVVPGQFAARDKAIPFRFEDGSQIELRPQAEFQVAAIRKHGASIRLVAGTIAVDVKHFPDSRWDISAGQFAIHVVGTRFEATWNPSSQRLAIRMADGEVNVSGACLQHSEALIAPANKIFACSERAKVDPPSGPAHIEGNVESNESDPSKTQPRHQIRSKQSPTVEAPLPTWKVRAEKGDFEAAIAVMNEADMTTAMAEESATMLLQLGDALRLRSDLVHAENVYRRVVERFADQTQAAQAAFRLGVMAERAGKFDDAIAWFTSVGPVKIDRPFAEEALGRLLELHQTHGDHLQALGLAKQYVELFPRGAYHTYAKSIIDAAVSDEPSKK